MPRLSKSLPKYRKHKRSGQAIVTIGGKDHYLGPYGTKASKLEYDRIVSEWLAAGRALPADDGSGGLTVAELCARYWRFAKGHYRKRGKGTSELDNIRYALRPLRELYGNSDASDFGPLALKALQVRMIESGLSRGVINSRVGKIKRVFRWAVSEELAPASLMHALSTVMGLQKGRTNAREADPVKPVANEVVDTTLPFLPPVVGDIVRFHRLTGCRPQDVCNLRPCDVDRTSDVWLYSPESHKTEHHGRSHIVAIGPKAQNVLRPYLLREATAHCFSPADSERKRKEALRAKRQSKVQPSQQIRSKRGAERKLGDRYTTQSYLYAVTRACERAFPPSAPLAKRADETIAAWKSRLTAKQESALKAWHAEHGWSPNQLRHTAATEIRSKFGLEAAQVTLGHSNANVTQIYAERDLAKAAEIMRQVG